MEPLERPRTVREFQKMFQHIYHKTNKQHYTDSDLIRVLMEEISLVMESARKDRRKELLRQLARTFSWFNAVASRFDCDLQEILWYKYPAVCPYCLLEKDCICGTEHPKIPNKEEALRRLRRDRRGHEPETLHDHQLLHAKLYGWQNDRILLIQTAAHLAEEAGEMSKEFRHKNIDQAKHELADIASWIFALATRLEINLEDAVWAIFPYECEICKEESCRCEVVP